MWSGLTTGLSTALHTLDQVDVPTHCVFVYFIIAYHIFFVISSFKTARDIAQAKTAREGEDQAEDGLTPFVKYSASLVHNDVFLVLM